MDTTFFQQALDKYRARSGDHRTFSELPVRVQSQLLQDAQSRKDAAAVARLQFKSACPVCGWPQPGLHNPLYACARKEQQ
jgi:hypothetical protein